MRVEPPFDPRIMPLVELRRIIPLPGDNAEAKAERRILRRMDLKEQLR